MLDNLILGFSTIATLPCTIAIIAGVIIGIICGALPGLSASTTVALMVPFTFGMDPIVAIVLLISVYQGSEYGGSITSIAVGMPGNPSAAVTVIDGYELTKQGKPGLALMISLIGSTFGGIAGAFVLFAFAEPLANVALSFGAPEYFSLAVFGLAIIASLAGDNLLKGFLVMFIGLFLSTIGLDGFTGEERYVFGVAKMMDGLGIIPCLIGLFAMATVFSEIENSMDSAIERIKVTFEKPDMKVVFGLWKVYVHSSIIGSIVGVLPGAGATIASFICYSEARRVSKHKELFGKGSLEGVAAPECGNNAVVGASLIPLLTLGIPSSATASVLVGALMLHNIQPGPLLFQTNGDIVYGIFAGVVMSSIGQLVFGLIGIPVWVKVISAPKPILLAVITVLSVIGAYGFNNSIIDVWIMLGFGVLGYVLTKINFPVTPIVLGLVLGGMMEENYRRALMVSGGDHSIFISHPISAGLLIVAALSLLSPLLYKKITQSTTT